MLLYSFVFLFLQGYVSASGTDKNPNPLNIKRLGFVFDSISPRFPLLFHYCPKPHQPQRHTFAVFQHLYTIIKSTVAHEAFFGNGKVVAVALEGAFRNALPFADRIDVKRVLARHLGIAEEEDVVVVAFDGYGEPPHIDRLLDALNAVFVTGNQVVVKWNHSFIGHLWQLVFQVLDSCVLQCNLLVNGQGLRFPIQQFFRNLVSTEIVGSH